MSDEKYLRGTCYHEAGHAVVGWSLGLTLGTIMVSDDASGDAQIAGADRLSLIDQIAVRSGGIAAEEVFGHWMHEHGGFGDRDEVRKLLRTYGIPEEEN